MIAKLKAMATRGLVVMLVLTGTITATAAPAAAACGSYCDDKAPDFWIQTGQYTGYTCADDGYPVCRRTVDRLWVELWYSPRCRTAWSWTSTSVSGFYVERLDPYRINYGTLNRYYGNVWSRMVNDANYLARACFHYPYGGTFCTNWW